MSITGLGASYKQQALSGLRDVSKMEAQREAANTQMAEQKKQSQIGSTMTGAALGASVGSAYYPVVGTIIGAAVGFLASSLFS